MPERRYLVTLTERVAEALVVGRATERTQERFVRQRLIGVSP